MGWTPQQLLSLWLLIAQLDRNMASSKHQPYTHGEIVEKLETIDDRFTALDKKLDDMQKTSGRVFLLSFVFVLFGFGLATTSLANDATDVSTKLLYQITSLAYVLVGAVLMIALVLFERNKRED